MGQLDAVVLWQVSEEMREKEGGEEGEKDEEVRKEDVKRKKKKRRPLFFMVYLARQACNVKAGYPHCHEADRMLQRVVKSYSLKVAES